MTKELNTNRLSISPIAWINDDDPSLGNDTSIEQCLYEMKNCGYHYTELGSTFPKDKRELKKMLQQHQILISSAWFSTFFTTGEKTETLRQFWALCSRLQYVGTKVINVCECGHSYHQNNTPIFYESRRQFSDKEWGQLIDGLHEMGRIASDFDLTLSYHFHLGTGVQNFDEVTYLMEHTCPELIGLLLDTGHASAANIDSIALLNVLGHRVNQVHLKDIRYEVLDSAKDEQLSFLQSVQRGIFTVPGDGDIDFSLIHKALMKLKYNGFYVVEAEQDPRKAVPSEYASKAKTEIEQWFRE